MQPKADHPQTDKPSDKDEASIPALRIGSFKVTQGTVTYEDHSHPDVFAARLEPINFELREFTTGVAGRPIYVHRRLEARRAQSSGMDMCRCSRMESDGEFHIDGLQVHTLWEYLRG